MGTVGFLYISSDAGWCEVLNDNRALALQHNTSTWQGSCDDCTCEALDFDPSDTLCPGSTPSALTWPPQPSGPTNPAPWFDPDKPESGSFYGFLVRRIVGHDDFNNLDRTVNQRITDGANVSAIRWAGRVITFELYVVGADECAVMYGVNWLGTVLSSLAPRCGSFDILMRTCCPELIGEPGSDEWLDSYKNGLITFKDVKLLQAPTWGEQLDFDDCTVRVITFSLIATDPCIYTECIRCEPRIVLPKPTDPPDVCDMVTAGFDEPVCAFFTEPPLEPLDCCEITGGRVYEGISAVVEVTNFDPSEAWGPVAIYVGIGQSGLECPDDNGSITWAYPLVIKEIPASSTIKIDGKKKLITIVQPGEPERPAYDFLEVSTGRVECWPATPTSGCDSVYVGINWGSYFAAWCAAYGSYLDEVSASISGERFYGCGEGCG